MFKTEPIRIKPIKQTKKNLKPKEMKKLAFVGFIFPKLIGSAQFSILKLKTKPNQTESILTLAYYYLTLTFMLCGQKRP